ncbi:MAG: acyl-CoA thioesterase [Fimbriimonadaceae bacterium]|nr:acyl-CoA thioesterase [Fimbriimonadaceae bacterium]
MYSVRILYADTDLAGVVYHGTYLRLFEAARTAALYDLGCDVAQLQAAQGIAFAISTCDLQFLKPVRYGELLQIRVLVDHVGPARVTLSYRGNVGQTLCVTGHTTFAALDLTSGKVVRLPAAMRRALEQAAEEHSDGS